MENTSMNFLKVVIYQNVKKKKKKKEKEKKKKFKTNISISMGHRHFEILWSFIFYILCRLVLSSRNSHYAYILLYMHKTLSTLGMRKNNSKLNFTKNRWTSLFLHGWLTISKCSIPLAQLSECSKSKVTPLVL